MSNSSRPHGLYSQTNSPGQNTGEGSLSLLQGIFPTQGLNSGLLHCRWILYHLKCRKPQFNSRVGKIRCRRDRLPPPVFLVFPCGSPGRESTCNAGDLGFIPGMGRSSGEGKGYPIQYSGLENSMDHIVHGVTKSWTWVSEFHLTFWG